MKFFIEICWKCQFNFRFSVFSEWTSYILVAVAKWLIWVIYLFPTLHAWKLNIMYYLEALCLESYPIISAYFYLIHLRTFSFPPFITQWQKRSNRNRIQMAFNFQLRKQTELKMGIYEWNYASRTRIYVLFRQWWMLSHILILTF